MGQYILGLSNINGEKDKEELTRKWKVRTQKLGEDKRPKREMSGFCKERREVSVEKPRKPHSYNQPMNERHVATIKHVT